MIGKSAVKKALISARKNLVSLGLTAIIGFYGSGCASVPTIPQRDYNSSSKSAYIACSDSDLINEINSVTNVNKKQSLAQMTADFVDGSPIPASVLNSRKSQNSGLGMGMAMDNSGKPTYTISYCAPSLKEFLNGMAMPFTLYRENKSTGRTEILPAYSRPFRSGGALSPEWGLIASGINGAGYLCGAKDSLVYNPFGDNPKLTWGMFVDQAAIAIIAGGMGGGSKGGSVKSESTQTKKDNNSDDKHEDKPTDPPVIPPVVPQTGGDGDGGAVGQ